MASWYDKLTEEEKAAFKAKVSAGLRREKPSTSSSLVTPSYSAGSISSETSEIEPTTEHDTKGGTLESGRHHGKLPLVTDAYRSFTYSTNCYAGPVTPGTYAIPEAPAVVKVFGTPIASIFGLTEDLFRRARLVRLAVELGEDTDDLQYQDDRYVIERLAYLEEE